MVAISLYRGNLHRVPDVPRRWLMPTHNISIRAFKTLLRRRSKALSHLPASSAVPAKNSPSPNPNRNYSNTSVKVEREEPGSSVLLGIERVGVDGESPSDDVKDRTRSDVGDGCLQKSVNGSDSLAVSKSYFPPRSSNPVENGVAHAKDENRAVSTNPNTEANKGDMSEDKEKRKKEIEEKLKVLNEKKHNLVQVLKQILHVEEELNVGDGCPQKSVNGSDPLAVSKSYLPPQSSNSVENGVAHAKDESRAVSMNPNAETNKDDESVDKEKRKKEVEDKLEVLNGKKRNIVQVLKQILHVEEEFIRRRSTQGMVRPSSAPLQVDAATDTVTRQLAPRLGSDVNVNGDAEALDADDHSNHNVHSRHMLRTSSISPSSESPLRRPVHIQPNVASHPSRPNLGIASSPSCLPPSGQQGHPPSLPTVSVSGTNYIASSPSPAASGGTSVSREARQPSPWN